MGMAGSHGGQNVKDGDPHSQTAQGDRWVCGHWPHPSLLNAHTEQKPWRLRHVNFNQKRHLKNIRERTVLLLPRGDKNYPGTQGMILFPEEMIQPGCQEDWPCHSDNETLTTPAGRTHSPTSGYPVISFTWKERAKEQLGDGGRAGGRGVWRGSGGAPPGENEAKRATDLAGPSEIRKCLLWQRANHELIIGT